MKKFFKKIWDFFLNLFKVIDENVEEIEEETPEIVDEIEVEEVPEVKPEIPAVQEPEPEKEVYVMLTNKERQTYFKEIGLYTIKIDNVRGPKQKNAEEIFNTIFLNKKSNEYTEETDKMLREIYATYKSSKYMTNSDWKYFKNFKKSEYKCKCKGKYCNGYPHEIHMRLVMEDQYLRNHFNAPVRLTSGLRCTQHNKNVGGVSKSNHMYGRASDKNIDGKSASDILKAIKTLPFNRYCYDITKKEVHGDVTP